MRHIRMRQPLAVAMVAVLGALTALAAKESTLATTQGASVTGSTLQQLIDQYIPAESCRLIILTQCYGGDMKGELENSPNNGNTAIGSATSEGEEAVYGGYDDDAAEALRPGAGRTGQTVHDAGTNGKHPDETPSTGGGKALSDFSLEDTSEDGDVQSRHVLVYAGKPDGAARRDNWQRDKIKQNFAGKTNTTVHTVGGDGTGGWDHPGSRRGLEDALKEIKDEFDKADDKSKEQFILYVTDHGDLEETKKLSSTKTIAPGDSYPPLTSGPVLINDYPYIDPPELFIRPDNLPALQVYIPYFDPSLPIPVGAPYLFPGDLALEVFVPALGYFDVFPLDMYLPNEFDNDLIGDQPGEGWMGLAPIPDEIFFVEVFMFNQWEARVLNNAPFAVDIDSIGITAGEMSKFPPLGFPFAPGDMNCDGVIDTFDIDPFILALSDPAGYAVIWPFCDISLADVNGDGNIDTFDIDPFIALIGS